MNNIRHPFKASRASSDAETTSYDLQHIFIIKVAYWYEKSPKLATIYLEIFLFQE